MGNFDCRRLGVGMYQPHWRIKQCHQFGCDKTKTCHWLLVGHHGHRGPIVHLPRGCLLFQFHSLIRDGPAFTHSWHGNGYELWHRLRFCKYRIWVLEISQVWRTVDLRSRLFGRQHHNLRAGGWIERLGPLPMDRRYGRLRSPSVHMAHSLPHGRPLEHRTWLPVECLLERRLLALRRWLVSHWHLRLFWQWKKAWGGWRGLGSPERPGQLHGRPLSRDAFEPIDNTRPKNYMF